uniref:Uncharacterized protein n=1 Tax=Knipowitschia caucasica TaxID=637954 RepID=A0AAV2M0F4_KNICA
MFQTQTWAEVREFGERFRMTSRWTFCFFLLTPISGLDPPCRCTVHPTQGLMVNCSSPDPPLRLHLPRDITQLQLSNTGLRTVPPGLFDSLNLKNLLAKESTITLYIDERHAILEASSLRSQKPKHRRSWGFLNKPVEPMERPLLGMELLPQTLQKKPNRKMKET